MNPTDARLFPDFAAVPTPAERRSSRTYWKAAQSDLFAAVTVAAAFAEAMSCPVCAGDHDGPCALGTAPDLFAEVIDNSAETVAARRAMFTSFGWGS